MINLWFNTSSEIKEEKMVEACKLANFVQANQVIQEKNLIVFKIPAAQIEEGNYQKDFFIGKRVKLDLKKGTILSESIVYSGEKIEKDIRIHNYNYIKLTDKLRKGDYIDIRISFANGLDFIILSKKRIVDLTFSNSQEEIQNSLWLQVTEEEILRLSSAAVDAFLNEGCSIYAVQYVSEVQEAAAINYPVNEMVGKLIKLDTNIIEYAENTLQSNLRKDLEKTIITTKTEKTNEQNIPEYLY